MEEFVLVALLVAGGWLLGVVGFFFALGARREVRALRAALAAGERIVAAGEEPVAAVPLPVPPVAGARPSPFGPPPFARGSVPPVGQPVGQPPEAVERASEEEPAEVVAPPEPAKPKIDIEALLTLRWGVWLGSAALLLAGVFLVRYAVEEGWLGPAVRSLLAFVLGGGLLAAAEWLRRRPASVLEGTLAADHAPAGLAAGGAAVLFGAAYAVGAMYALVPPAVGFVLMGAAALVGILASLRFGPLVGLVGVAAAFVTPALVEAEAPNAPGLFGYLLFVTAAACLVVRWSAWVWLGWIATVMGAGWVVLAATGALGTEYWAPGLFVPAAAALHLLLLPDAALRRKVGRRLAWVPFLALGLAGVAVSGEVDEMAVRVGVLLLAPLAVVAGARSAWLDRLPWLAALLFLFVLLMWAMPAWQPTGELITIEGAVQAFLPGEWAPQVIRPLLWTAAAMAGFFAAAGLVLERRARRPLRWAALVAAVPVLTLGVTYLQVARFQADPVWALGGAGLAAGLVAAAAAAMREGAKRRAGVHAAGAVAALCFGFAVVLEDQWLTLAVALMLPPLAWIEARADLRALRHVALVVAGLVIARLLLNWYVLDYVFGAAPVWNSLWLAYGVPAACFWVAGRMFLRRGDGLVVRVLEAGALAFGTVFVALLIRHWHGGGRFTRGGTLLEGGLHVSALWVQALGAMLLARRTGRAVVAAAWRVQGVLAVAGGVMLLSANPFWMDARASHAALAFAYLVPGVLAGVAAMQREARAFVKPLGVLALVTVFAWLNLEVRQLFHPGERLGGVPTDAEMWAFSGVWLAYGAALMAAGIRWQARAVRLAALGVVALTVAKVFLVDMAELDGLWRVLSFLGLGLSLIALGAVFRRFVAGREEVAPSEA
jgi:uncharacterized membrane protein